jgi:hypothetical protein
LQVAALEWEREDVNDNVAMDGIDQSLKELQKAVKKLKRECE